MVSMSTQTLPEVDTRPESDESTGDDTPDRPSPTHRGHWKPTDAGFMHSPQIGRPHRWHEMPVCRSAWR